MGMRLFVRLLDGSVITVNNCSTRMTVADLQRKICEQHFYGGGGGREKKQKLTSDGVESGSQPAAEQLVMSFGGEYAAPERALADLGLCEKFITHASGFVVESHDLATARAKLKKYVDGELVPLSAPEPDYDVYYPPITTTIFPPMSSAVTTAAK